MLTLLDGIYTTERGPSFDGRVRRSNIVVASTDVLSADMVGAKILGYAPSEVPHLVHAAKNHKRSNDVSEIEVVGETIEAVASRYKYTFPYNQDNSLPLPHGENGDQGFVLP